MATMKSVNELVVEMAQFIWNQPHECLLYGPMPDLLYEHLQEDHEDHRTAPKIRISFMYLYSVSCISPR